MDRSFTVADRTGCYCVRRSNASSDHLRPQISLTQFLLFRVGMQAVSQLEQYHWCLCKICKCRICDSFWTQDPKCDNQSARQPPEAYPCLLSLNLVAAGPWHRCTFCTITPAHDIGLVACTCTAHLPFTRTSAAAHARFTPLHLVSELDHIITHVFTCFTPSSHHPQSLHTRCPWPPTTWAPTR